MLVAFIHRQHVRTRLRQGAAVSYLFYFFVLF
jgi:hypothetical protein